MARTYGLVSASNMRPLNLPLMTRDNAELCRDKLASLGKSVLVVNFKAE